MNEGLREAKGDGAGAVEGRGAGRHEGGSVGGGVREGHGEGDHRPDGRVPEFTAVQAGGAAEGVVDLVRCLAPLSEEDVPVDSPGVAKVFVLRTNTA